MRGFLSRFSFEVGFILITFVTLLMLFSFKFPMSHFELGKSEYKSLSGVLLCFFIFEQWRIARFRLVAKPANVVRAQVARHKLLGLAGPLLFFIHAQKYGHGYFALLTACFFGATFGGVLHEKIVEMKNPTYIRISLISHIAFSTILVGLICFHVFSLSSFGLAPKGVMTP